MCEDVSFDGGDGGKEGGEEEVEDGGGQGGEEGQGAGDNRAHPHHLHLHHLCKIPQYVNTDQGVENIYIFSSLKKNCPFTYKHIICMVFICVYICVDNCVYFCV